jgi:hypothetical protein
VAVGHLGQTAQGVIVAVIDVGTEFDIHQFGRPHDSIIVIIVGMVGTVTGIVTGIVEWFDFFRITPSTTSGLSPIIVVEKVVDMRIGAGRE